VRPVGGQHSIDLEGSTRDTRVFEIEINPVGARGPMSRFDPPETKGMPGASPIRKHISGNSLPGHFGSVGLVPEGVNLEIDASSRWGVLQVEFPVDGPCGKAVETISIDALGLIQVQVVRSLVELHTRNLYSRDGNSCSRSGRLPG